jgi:hypothetical protein
MSPVALSLFESFPNDAAGIAALIRTVAISPKPDFL